MLETWFVILDAGLVFFWQTLQKDTEGIRGASRRPVFWADSLSIGVHGVPWDWIQAMLSLAADVGGDAGSSSDSSPQVCEVRGSCLQGSLHLIGYATTH